MAQEEGGWLVRVRAADETRKKRWLVISTIVVMILVIYIWLAYFNSLISPVGQTVASDEARNDFSIWQTLDGGLRALGTDFQVGLGRLYEWLFTQRRLLIKPFK